MSNLKFYCPEVKVPHFFANYLRAGAACTTLPEAADYLVLPFMYEIVYDYDKESLDRIGVGKADLEQLKALTAELDALSVKTGRPLIVLFYRDPWEELPFGNALIFRTSARAALMGANSFGLPAFLADETVSAPFVGLPKPLVPQVSFRGKAMPLKLIPQLRIREEINHAMLRFNLPWRVKNFGPEGYFLRRRAVLSCLRKAGSLHTDFVINPTATAADYTAGYKQSFAASHYMIMVAGFGNYAYRLYEIMRAGRIPVFIDTDALLPCADVIDWKRIMLWVPAKSVDYTADIILDYHSSIHPDDFMAMQYELYHTYWRYCTTGGFAAYLVHFLQKQKSH